ncbi:recombinase family protein [Paraferrimonas sedimenticola]|uniref:Integrase n=1 Tax=Paraferrimonas sedimenticola TaxID=375674 RepID=A0AA37RSQ0_9GAMM|nr:recombinase family protein [Paraferrimonas sedimenticola]GLP95250.1 integrase [Paraferrimonas sedimenticola]
MTTEDSTRLAIQPTIITYQRVSTERQVSGTGLQQQRDQALLERLSEQHGLPIDNRVFSDEGKSAFKGDNLKEGSELSRILNLLHSGEIAQGSILVVTNADRLSRQKVYDSVPMLMSIINAGLRIYTSMDNHLYDNTKTLTDPTSGLTDIIKMALSLDLAHQESAKKSERITQAARLRIQESQAGLDVDEDGYRKAVVNGNSHPFWVTAKSGYVRPSKLFDAAQWAAQQYAQGVTIDEIVTQLKRDYPSKPWSTRGMQKFFGTGRAMIGEHRINLKGESHTITGYYPRLLTEEEFERFQARRIERSVKRTSAKFYNPYAGLFVCAVCGSNMVSNFRVVPPNSVDSKPTGKIVYRCASGFKHLRATDAEMKTCKGGGASSDRLDHALCVLGKTIDLIPNRDGMTQAQINSEITKLDTSIDRLVEQIVQQPSKGLEAALLRLEAKRAELEIMEPTNIDVPQLKIDWNALDMGKVVDASQTQERIEFNRLLCQTFSKIVIEKPSKFTMLVKATRKDNGEVESIEVKGRTKLKWSRPE